jgi:hypothetical protein
MATNLRVMYLVRGKAAVAGPASSLEAAAKDVAFYKRRGFTAWVENSAGEFIPVAGAARKPKSID